MIHDVINGIHLLLVQHVVAEGCADLVASVGPITYGHAEVLHFIIQVEFPVLKRCLELDVLIDVEFHLACFKHPRDMIADLSLLQRPLMYEFIVVWICHFPCTTWS